MKKTMCLLLVFILLAGLLCGCGSAKSYDAAEMSYAGNYSNYAKAESYDYAAAETDYGWETTTEEYKEEASASPEKTTGSNLPANVKLIYTASIDMESTEFDTTVAALNTMVNDMGGYYESSNLENYSSGYRCGYYTVRIPAENFQAFCDGLGGLCQVRNLSQNATDVSEAYYDLESRLTTQRTKLERLQALLAQAEDMEDIITLESAISETELTIENLTGSLRKYDSLVGYSTINISLREVYKLTDVEQPVIGFGAKLAEAFKSGCSRFVDNLEDFLLGFARAWVGWLIFLAVVAVVILLIRRGVLKRRARREANPPVKRNRESRRRKSSESAGNAVELPQQTENEE